MDKKDSLYDFSEAYDIAFSYRNYEYEANFLLSFMQNKPHTSLEIAGGPARHSLSLAKKGLNVDALDNSSKMIEYSKKLFHSNQLEINYFNQDMILFDLEKNMI